MNIIGKTIFKTAKFLLTLLLILLAIAIFFIFVFRPWYFFKSEQKLTSGSFAFVLKSALRIPHNNPLVMRQMKNSLEDLEEITYEEMMDIKCNCPRDEKNIYETKKSQEEKHRDCLSPSKHSAKFPFINVMPNHCENIFNCPAITVEMNEYILRHPKFLNNVIKIIEKPCFYLKELPLSPEEDGDKNFSVSRQIKIARRNLYCDKLRIYPYEKNKTYSVVNIIDSTGRAKMQLVVPRKDNLHIPKNWSFTTFLEALEGLK